MSSTFDPSNLDLDLNSQDKNPVKLDLSAQEEKLPENPVDEKKQSIENKIPEPDILDSIDIDVAEKEASPTDETNAESVKEIPSNWEKNNIESPSEVVEKQEEIENVAKEEAEKKDEEIQKIIDINISTLDDLVILSEEKTYDYIIIEPGDSEVKITFRQDNIDKEVKYVKYPVYTNILFKVKQITGLVIEDTWSAQEWKWLIKIGAKSFKVLSKTAPGQNGERIWIKTTEDTSVKEKKVAKKTSLSTIFGFLGTILFIALILFGMFIGFIVFNASDVSDVQFFQDIGININDVNDFIEQAVHVIFWILIFIVSSALFVSLFKFFTTKKAYKRKKIIYGVLSSFLIILTLVVGTLWMAIYQKVQALPNWLEKERGNLQIFDNTLLISDDFTKDDAYLQETENLTGPVTLKFDLSNFENDRSNQIFNIRKYTWDMWGETVESFSPEIIHTFSTIGNYEITVTVDWEDSSGEDISQTLSDVTTISIIDAIIIEETITNSGWKRLFLNAESLRNRWDVSWYLYEPTTESNPNPNFPTWEKVWEGYEFIPRNIFFEEAYIGVNITSGEDQSEVLDKIIRISSEWDSEITGEIVFEQSLENNLEYTFYIENPSTWFTNGFIESYDWEIEDKTYALDGELNENTNSKKFTHTFESFGDQFVQVTLTDSSGQSVKINKTISIQKQIQLKSFLDIKNNWNEIEGINYEATTHEFFIDDLWIPTTLEFDARYVRPESIRYVLLEASWDVGNDGNIDGSWKNFSYEVPTEWSHVIVVEYTFNHRNDPDDIIKLKESIFIEAVKKEAILDLKMEYPSDYAPVTVRFDASASFIKNDDIIKFEYDYWDGIVEERDAINPGHRYTQKWDYTVKLTVTGKSWKTYSTTKSLILLPAPQEVEISTSLKRAPVWQGIDFSSAGSSGQIVEYFWDFGDGNISTEANPSYSYPKAWTYTVKLQAEFSNKNSITDEVEIEIYDVN